MEELALLQKKAETIAVLREKYAGDAAGLKEAVAAASKIHDKAVAKMKREARGERELTKKQKLIDAAAFKGPKGEVLYSAFKKFPDVASAKAALRECAEEASWFTSPSGAPGSNKHISYHGSVTLGNYMIKTLNRDGTGPAIVYAKNSNGSMFPQPSNLCLQGGEDVDDEEGGERTPAPACAAHSCAFTLTCRAFSHLFAPLRPSSHRLHVRQPAPRAGEQGH